MFCMFSPTDPALIRALLATGDRGKLLFGMLNSISDPSKKKKKKADNLSDSASRRASRAEATKVQVELFQPLAQGQEGAGLLVFPSRQARRRLPARIQHRGSQQQVNAHAAQDRARRAAPPAVHIHHKFIIIDADTDSPTIYTGSANLSENSTHQNDENLLEITGSPELAQTYLAEFMRIYEHYRARALWNIAHPGAPKAATGKARMPPAARQSASTDVHAQDEAG